MQRRVRTHGSAMILALIVVIIVVGLGGAFLADSASQAQMGFRAIESDEATMLAEAALERTRRALYV